MLPGGPAGYRERLLAKNFESFYSHSGRKFLRTISPYNLPRRPVLLLISADSACDVPQQRFGRVFALNPGMKEGEGKGREQGDRREKGIMQNNGGIVRMA